MQISKTHLKHGDQYLISAAGGEPHRDNLMDVGFDLDQGYTIDGALQGKCRGATNE